MLREFGALPTEDRVKAMLPKDYLWCVLQMMLDDDERVAALCPACREERERGRCPSCGGEVSTWQGAQNGSFDEERFLRMKGGEDG